MRAAVITLLVVACSGGGTRDTAPVPAGPEAALVGTRPPEWQAERWLNGPPLTLASLRGKVVLVRWWTAGCPFCSTSAPALRDFETAYADRGLVVVGLYHHKDAGPLDPVVVERTARDYGFRFPIAVDTDWRTLDAWMRGAAGEKIDTGFTSVTFVLDRDGVVRHVHPGGQYVAGDRDHAALKAAIERLLPSRARAWPRDLVSRPAARR